MRASVIICAAGRRGIALLAAVDVPDAPFFKSDVFINYITLTA
jgi:hypothetical protein